jgi:isoamylase
MPVSARPEVIDYIKSLGVTSVELLPIHTFVNDSHLLEKKLTNYWGYNSIGFFRARSRIRLRRRQQPARVQGDGRRAYHAAGLEIILDVVYNHTAEGQRARPDPVLQGHRQRVSYYRLHAR